MTTVYGNNGGNPQEPTSTNLFGSQAFNILAENGMYDSGVAAGDGSPSEKLLEMVRRAAAAEKAKQETNKAFGLKDVVATSSDATSPLLTVNPAALEPALKAAVTAAQAAMTAVSQTMQNLPQLVKELTIKPEVKAQVKARLDNLLAPKQ